MRSRKYEYQSEFARKYVAQGREEGLEEVRAQRREERRQQGLIQPLQQALMEVLDVRGLEVDDQARQRLQACTDPDQIKYWLRRAVTVPSVQALFEPKHEPSSK